MEIKYMFSTILVVPVLNCTHQEIHFKRPNFRSHFIFYFYGRRVEFNLLFVTCYHKMIYLKIYLSNKLYQSSHLYQPFKINNSVDDLKCNQNLERIPNIFELLQVS